MKHTQSKAQPLTCGESVYVFYAMTKTQKDPSFAKLPVMAQPNLSVQTSLGRRTHEQHYNYISLGTRLIFLHVLTVITYVALLLLLLKYRSDQASKQAIIQYYLPLTRSPVDFQQ